MSHNLDNLQKIQQQVNGGEQNQEHNLQQLNPSSIIKNREDNNIGRSASEGTTSSTNSKKRARCIQQQQHKTDQSNQGVGKEEKEAEEQSKKSKPNIISMTKSTSSPLSSSSSSTATFPKIKRMNLEAIFHPKFENESLSDQQIRSQMITNVTSNKGHLEVSLKHSGSLLLWSGGQRFYSKNATDNIVTHVGEILLRQHFIRAWGSCCGGGNSQEKQNFVEQKFKECSNYIEQHQLTLAFEVVTSVMGHHGDIPNHDYMILLSIADKATGTFYKTLDLLSLAQRFRLPHNDMWIFQSQPSAKELFHLYDTSREDGTAEGVINTLSKAADGGYVESMCPHVVFQGNILEGVVIRYVPYGDDNGDESREKHLERMKTFSSSSQEILKLAPPPPRASSLSSKATVDSSFLWNTIDIRDILEQNPVDDEFQAAIKSKLQSIHEKDSTTPKRIITRKRHHDASTTSMSIAEKTIPQMDLPKMASTLLKSHCNDATAIDYETKLIAKLIQTLEELGGKVSYNILYEENKIPREEEDGDNDVMMNNDEPIVTKHKGRYICIVHVFHDSTFQKYHKVTSTRNDDHMVLYRGFSIEITLDGDNDNDDCVATTEQMNSVSLEESTVTHKVANDQIDVHEEKLMLKMKFLPYMVRTFICRNGLRILTQSGSKAFDMYALNQFNKWGMSLEAQTKWMPFFHGWGIYCESQLLKKKVKKKQQSSAASLHLPPLNSTCYLSHYDHYEKIFRNGEAAKMQDIDNNSNTSSFHGVMAVIGVNVEKLGKVAKAIAEELKCPRIITDSSELNNAMTGALSQNGGIICTTAITKGAGIFRKLKKNGSDLYFVLAGCTENEIDLSLDEMGEEDETLRRKMKGMTNSWRKTDCTLTTEISLDEMVQLDQDGIEKNKNLIELVNKIKSTVVVPERDYRPGMLVFFPGIPGSGKSTLCEDLTAESLGLDVGEKRKLNIKVGDKVKGKYYPLIEKEKLDDPSSIYIADKNVPPISWKSIAKVCTNTGGVPVPVFPDSRAFCDSCTITSTIQKKNGQTIQTDYDYPFSLHYLAVCMNRVLHRKPNTHAGKLDSATETACMVVVKFYCLYKRFTAKKMMTQLQQIGGEYSPVLTIPFFVEGELPNLPQDLETTLHDAISLQHTMDAKGVKGMKNECLAIENRLRSALSANQDFLLKLVADEQTSKDAFSSQLSSHVKALDDPNSKTNRENNTNTTAIKVNRKNIGKIEVRLVAIDVKNAVAKNVLDENRSIADAFHSILENKDKEKQTKKERRGEFKSKLHVTMAHSSEMSQEEIHSKFDSLVGKTIELEVKSFLFSDEVAALEVTVASKTGTSSEMTDKTVDASVPLKVPHSKNEFEHITVWCAKDVPASTSNELPFLVKEGNATQIPLQKPMILEGKLSFWFKGF